MKVQPVSVHLTFLSVYQTDSSVAESHAGQGLESLKCCYISAIRT
jgi:hypothetical protein